MTLKKKIEGQDLALKIADLAEDLKASDVMVMDLRKLSNFSDYFVICSGDSDTHARAIADHVVDELEAQKINVLHQEGSDWGLWVLLDYGDVVVHVFEKDTRQYYDLERLWGDADIVRGAFPVEEKKLTD